VRARPSLGRREEVTATSHAAGVLWSAAILAAVAFSSSGDSGRENGIAAILAVLQSTPLPVTLLVHNENKDPKGTSPKRKREGDETAALAKGWLAPRWRSGSCLLACASGFLPLACASGLWPLPLTPWPIILR
jgi:hypothetical protein